MRGREMWGWRVLGLGPVVIGMVPLVVACSGGEDSGGSVATFTVRDSAGIEIVEYSQAALDALPLFEVSDEFEMSVGEQDGDEPYLFDNIRAAALLTDGRIAVMDRATVSVRYFSAAGEFVGQVGRRGEGPGEFASPDGVWHYPGDTLRIWDPNLRRLSTVTGPGAPVTSVHVEAGGRGRRRFAGRYDDGSLFFWATGDPIGADGLPYPASYGFRIVPPGESGEPGVAGGPGEPLGAARIDTIAVLAETRRPSTEPPPIWVNSPAVSFHPDGAWQWMGMLPQVELIDREGNLLRIIRWEQRDPTVVEADYDRWMEDRLAPIPEDQRLVARERLSTAVVPDVFPAVGALIAGTAGEGLIYPYPRPRDPEPPELLRVSSEGRIVARIRGWSPREPTPFSFDRVITVDEDEFGVERVRVRELVEVPTPQRSGPGSGP